MLSWGTNRRNMSGFLNLGIVSLAQAHLVYLVVNSQISLRVRSRLKLPKILQELFACPVCTGFWIALILARFHPIETLAVGFLGSVLYEAKEKFFPCKQCANTVKASEWKIS